MDRVRAVSSIGFGLLRLGFSSLISVSFHAPTFCKANAFYFFSFTLCLLGLGPLKPTPPFYPGID